MSAALTCLVLILFASPPDIARVWHLPPVQTRYQVLQETSVGHIVVQDIRYNSRAWRGKKMSIFGYICRPAGHKRLPGLVLVHGGGGMASREDAIRWASGGYVVLSIDLPGKGQRRDGSLSTGPDMTEGCTWDRQFSQMSRSQRKAWGKLLDPRNFLASQHAPLLFLTGTNDNCYYLPTFQKTYQAIRTSKWLWVVPGQRHLFDIPPQRVTRLWLADQLHSASAPEAFPRINTTAVDETRDGSVVVRAAVSGGVPPYSIRFSWARGGPQGWTEKYWSQLPCNVSGRVRRQLFLTSGDNYFYRLLLLPPTSRPA